MIDLLQRELLPSSYACIRAHVDSVQADKGGNPDIVRESQKKRGASVELVDEVIALFQEHKQGQYKTVAPSWERAEGVTTSSIYYDWSFRLMIVVYGYYLHFYWNLSWLHRHVMINHICHLMTASCQYDYQSMHFILLSNYYAPLYPNP
jgi:hypothetical protein